MNLDFTYYNPTKIHFGKTVLNNLENELGTTEEMLPQIANSTVLGGGYKKLSAEDILNILKEAY